MLRFGTDGTYDGTHGRLQPRRRRRRRGAPRAGRAAARCEPGVRQQQTLVADELRKFSLYTGRRPRPRRRHDLGAAVGADVAGVGGARSKGSTRRRSQAWRSARSTSTPRAAAHRRRQRDAARPRAAHHRRGDHAARRHQRLAAKPKTRSTRCTPASSTRRPKTPTATLDAAVRHLDVVTAALDGLRTQLLGLAGQRRPAPPRRAGQRERTRRRWRRRARVLAGCVTLTRARLLDAFGRTLDVPAGERRRTPTRASLAGAARRAAAARRGCCGRRAGCSASSTPRRRWAPRARRRASTRSRPRCRSTRWPAS